MYEVTSDQELDQLVWSLIKGSRNPLDYLDYLRHMSNAHHAGSWPTNVCSLN